MLTHAQLHVDDRLQLEQLLQQERESLRRQRAALGAGGVNSGSAADKMQVE